MTDNKPVYFPAIDGLRFVAFLLVFLSHFSIYIPSIFFHQIGWTGVELFFLISGFLLTRLLITEKKLAGKIDFKKFFIRRILRIWPLYFTYVIVALIIGVFYFNEPFNAKRLLGNLFFIDNFFSAVNGYNDSFASFHLWSISLEEQFYLVLPFLTYWLSNQNNKLNHTVFGAILILLLLSRYLFVHENFEHPFYYVLPISGDSFLAGIMLGTGIYDKWIQKINPGITFITGCGLLISLFFLSPRWVIGFSQVYIYFIAALAFSFFFIAALSINKGVFHIILTNKIIRYLGKISFGLYVFHAGIITLTHSFFLYTDTNIKNLSLPVSLLLTIALAILSYEFFEKRFLRLKKNYTIIHNRKI